jgi:DNA-binding transcriptional LysR family regulator
VNPLFKIIPLYSEGILLVKSPSFDLKGEKVDLLSCSNLPFVHMDWGEPFSDWLEQETGGKNFSGIEVDSSTLLIELLKSNTGISFLLKNLADEHIQRGELEEVPYTCKSPSPLKTIYLTYSKKNQSKLEIEHFIAFMKQMSETIGNNR